jgi:PKD repeat protein
MKRLLLALLGSALSFAAVAQCSVIEVPLSQRASSSDVIVEGKVIAKKSYWDVDGTMIYTASTIEVYKVFKGSLSSPTIQVLTQGGIVGDRMIKVEPSLNLAEGQVGIFTCETVKRIRTGAQKFNAVPQFEAYASVQGFVKYDLETSTAADPFHVYNDIESELYTQVLSPALSSYIEVKPFDIHSGSANRSSAPQQQQQFQMAAITNISPTTITAGTGSVLTITGSNFGATQGSGSVRFRNADDGGATFVTPLASQYLSWSSTQITVEVPSSAGTGTVQVIQGQTFTSAQTLTVSYAHLNVEFDPGSGTVAYETDHINDNGSGGYTWRMNTAFSADAAANASFMRAFNSWRCSTGINWTIGSTTSINDAVSDGTNVICFDNTAPLSAGILGVCYSYWSGCASGPTIIWYVNELDIIFDEGSNITPLTWEYGTALPSGSEYDFETVAVHELGHGHQLGHVISPGAIMHYSISNGTANRTPGSDDLAGGNYVQAKSIVTNVCGPGAMSNHSCVSAPVAAFSGAPTAICEGSSVSFSDLSTNTPTSWSWTFPGGTPSASTSQNPSVTYSTPGTYAVSLTATNSAGSNLASIAGYITVNANPTAGASVTAVSCNGGSNGAINLTPAGGQAPYTFLWAPSGATTEDRTGLSAGTHSVTVTDDNGCAVQTSFSVTEPVALSNGMSKTDATCANNDGTATATPAGGTAPYTYSWTPGGQTTQIATGLAGGSYTCTVTDANGCTINGNVTVSTAACAGPTQLTVASCGITLNSLSQAIYCTPVANATNYRYNFVNAQQGYSATFARGSSATNFFPTAATGLQYGRTYSVRVAAYVNGSWSAWGNACTVATPAFPSTQLTNASCGSTLAAVSTPIYCTAVTGATNYQWKIENAALGFSQTKYRGSNATNFMLSWVSGIATNTTYTITVRAMVGGNWGTYGTPCTVTTGPVAMIVNGNSTEMPDDFRRANPEQAIAAPVLSLDVYPNPFNENVTLLTNGATTATIYNAIGEAVRTVQITGEKTEISLADLSPGIYIVRAASANGQVTKRIVKQ